MAKKNGTKKTFSDRATTSENVRATPHQEGFHGETSSVSKSIEETRKYHKRYLRAINSTIRRKILRALKDGCATIEDLQSRTDLAKINLEWHLRVLEQGFCVEKDHNQGKLVYRLTQEGKVVDYL